MERDVTKKPRRETTTTADDTEMQVRRFIDIANHLMDHHLMNHPAFQNTLVNGFYDIDRSQQRFLEDNPEANRLLLNLDLTNDPLHEESQRYAKSIFFTVYQNQVYQLNLGEVSSTIQILDHELRGQIQTFIAFQDLYKEIILNNANSVDAIFIFEQKYAVTFADTCQKYINFLDDHKMYLNTSNPEFTLKIKICDTLLGSERRYDVLSSCIVKLDGNNFFRTSEFVESMCNLAMQNSRMILKNAEMMQQESDMEISS